MSGIAGTAEALKPCVYFMVHRDFCDHLVFRNDGTFMHGSSFVRRASGGRGRWSLVKDSAGKYVLQLHWDAMTDQVGPRQEQLVSPDGFAFGSMSQGLVLNHVEGASLAALEYFESQQPSEVGTTSERVAVSQNSVADELASPLKKRGLVFSSVGQQCLPVVQEWLRTPSALDFDIALVFYKDAASAEYKVLQDLSSAHTGVEVFQHEGMKWPNFRYWIDLQGGLEAVEARYDYIWVVDDDVRLSTADISRMFSILRDHDEIAFACPSFDAGSDGVWRFFDGHDPRFKLRYTNFVECTAPVLKASMLLDPKFQPCLRAVRTGCFIDFCFHPAAGGRQDAVAVIDAVQCHHPPRTREAPSEMRQVQAWHDHKKDDVYFEQEGVPKEWWSIEPRFFQPRIFNAIPKESI
eukprot:TRINITY_DN7631_c0_g5_i1.p1 TRINITY_DN7631_c0_g5~~TRINITY_DN7631_c0_g5_i1.p1  ORF type:complete len:426 (-),score=61.85 TRINITY_DN7631_c0_g5_i1:271-1491(-)